MDKIKLAQEIIDALDKAVSDLAALGLYEFADHLEELTGDLEEASMMLKREQYQGWTEEED